MAHLPGQKSGRALVKVLYGDVSPSGKLPYTLAKNESDYSIYGPCTAELGVLLPQCDYAEGVYLDYRDFDARNITPRYEFGYGISYTTFEYSSLFVQGPLRSLELVRSSGTGTTNSSTGGDSISLWSNVAKVQVTITNNGPSKQLRGFEKLPLSPGESNTAVFDLAPRDISIWSVEAQQWVAQNGRYSVYVGASSRVIRLTGFFDF
ncbi:hypothetical protein BDZ45DRAFT_740750 [Acephala macrosclerotiorum]|nr:hypothetical protein BDZ45DRAFT_740750 [Acephala macrosclerotiorum]